MGIISIEHRDIACHLTEFVCDLCLVYLWHRLKYQMKNYLETGQVCRVFYLWMGIISIDLRDIACHLIEFVRMAFSLLRSTF